MPGVVLHTSNANTWEDEVRGLSKFKTNLGIIARYCLLKEKSFLPALPRLGQRRRVDDYELEDKELKFFLRKIKAQKGK